MSWPGLPRAPGETSEVSLLRLELARIEQKVDELARAVWSTKRRASAYAGFGALLGSLGPRLPDWLRGATEVVLSALF